MGFNLHSMSLSRGIILHRLPLASAKPSITAARSTTQPQVVVAAHVPRPREVDSRRRSANYKPTTWDYEFLQSFEINDIDDDELYKDRVVMLEKELKVLLASENMEEMLELIDDIQRLGLSHRFENEIQDALKRFLHTGGCHNITNKSIYHVALGFRLLRQNGYHVSQDVFKEYVNEKGVFDGDVKDMLSLYEASYLAYDGEDMLDKANAQTTSYLNNFMSQTNFNDDLTVKKLVRHSLEVPLHRRMEMLEARWYIETYKETKGANHNHALIKLATLEFNMAQSVLQADLKDTSRWWSNLGLAKEMSFSRDRLVECFFWTVGMMFEPRFSSCRKGLTKVTSFITTIDDIYDVYGTLEELKLFTDAVERWDINAVHTLPNYMKPCFTAFYNTVNDMANETLHTHGSNISPHLVKAWAEMLKAFLKEAEWSYDKSGAAPPTFQQYIENGWRSVSGTVILVHAYCFLNGDDDGHVFSKEMLEDHLMSYHKIVRWPSVIFRLCNDLATSSGEIARGETVNAISCYMNENGVSEEEARKHLKSMIDQAWKNMNQELLLLSPVNHMDDDNSTPKFAKSFIRSVFNLARIAHYTYQRGDSHGNPDAGSKKTVFSLIFEPIVNDSKLKSLN